MRRLIYTTVFLPLLFILNSCSDDKSKDKEYKSDLNKEAGKNEITECRKMFAEAQSLDSMLFASTSELDRNLGNKAIKIFSDYVNSCADDTLGPVFLIKTSQIAKALNNLEQARHSLTKCIEKYPQFKDLPAAMFLLAQLYDEHNYMNNEEEARKWYQEIIDKYPKSPEAESAKGALKYIGKSDEEIMEDIKKNEKRNFQIN